jgi:hypothetical protein
VYRVAVVVGDACWGRSCRDRHRFLLVRTPQQASAEGLVYETSNSSKSPNSSAELAESYSGKFCELPVLAEKNHHHFESDPHH